MFERWSDRELLALSEEALLEYLRAARAAGDVAAARRAVAILVVGRLDAVRYRVGLRLPSWAVEDVTQEVLVRAISAAFAGESVGQFQAWLDTITRRTVADFYRQRGARPGNVELPEVGQEAAALVVEDFSGATETGAIFTELLGELSERHRTVVCLQVAGHSAAEICERITEMTEANVHQIMGRFRRRMRDRLNGGLG